MVDHCVFNKPTVSQDGAIWIESSMSDLITSKYIQVCGKNSKIQIIKHYIGCHDSLQYPLIFTNAELRWRRGVERMQQNRETIQQRQTYQGKTILTPTTIARTDEVINAENKGSIQRSS